MLSSSCTIWVLPFMPARPMTEPSNHFAKPLSVASMVIAPAKSLVVPVVPAIAVAIEDCTSAARVPLDVISSSACAYRSAETRPSSMDDWIADPAIWSAIIPAATAAAPRLTRPKLEPAASRLDLSPSIQPFTELMTPRESSAARNSETAVMAFMVPPATRASPPRAPTIAVIVDAASP